MLTKDNVNAVEKAFNGVRDLYLNALKKFGGKNLEWFQNNYGRISLILKNFFIEANEVYKTPELNDEDKVKELLKIKSEMLEEIKIYQNK